jgi:lipopolysaccharide transport system permease protein
MSAFSRLAQIRHLGIGPVSHIKAIVKNHALLRRVSEQELSTRYRESLLGPLWAILLPLAQLVVFTFVFGQIIPSRLGTTNQGPLELPLNLFAGILIYTLFSEVVTRSATVLSENASYIKRVVFPVEILPISIILTAFANMAISLLLLILAITVTRAELPPVTALALPLVVLPFLLMLAGLSWMTSAISLYLPDFRHAVTPAVGLFMFLSPVLFPVSSIPESYRIFVYLNPVTVPVEQLRAILLQGAPPDAALLALYAIIAWFVAWLGYGWFVILRRGFADVV